MNKFKLISLCTLGALGCGTASMFLNPISASARYYDLRNERSNSEIKLDYIKVENVSEKSLDVIIKYNSETEITSNGFPVWSTGYYYNMHDVPEENITKIGYNEFKVRIDMREVGNGSDYIYIGLHPRDKNGSHFVIDFAIKLDETAPNLEKTLSNDKNWTNQNVSLKAKANDNFNIVEFLKLYKDDKVVKEYETFSNPKILYISLDDEANHSKDFINLGYNITTKNSNSIKSINDVKGYDVIIYDGIYWSVPSELAVILNQAFDEGESILTTFNDGSNGLAIAKDEVAGTSGKYAFSSPYKYVAEQGAYHNLGRSDRFAYRLNGYSETDSGLSILKPADQYSIVLSKSVCTDYKGENKVGEGAGVLYRTGVRGNKWIHMQTYSPMYNNAMRKAVDEIMTGVLKTRQNYERNFEITENGNYKLEAVDFFGNKKEENFTISNIDKVAPELDYIDGTKGWNNTGKYKIVCKDNLSGVKSISVNGKVYNSSSADVEFANNGDYDLVITDNAGNVTNKKITISNIDKDVPNVCNISAKTTFIDTDSSKRKLTFSFPSLLDVQSGIKGYSYIVDKNPNTIPDDVVDTTNTIIERDVTDEGDYYLHIKAIDNVGNVGNTSHKRLSLANLNTSYEVSNNTTKLKWDINDYINKTFKIFRKDEVSNAYQNVSSIEKSNLIDDSTAKDLKAPNKPLIYEHKFIGLNRVEFKFNKSEDNGSKYKYYIESNNKTGDELGLSNVVSANVTTGLKGYSYIVDNNPNTIPDNNINLDKSKTSLTIDGMNKQKQYIHIKSIDNAGNSSEVLHFKVEETSNPTINIMGNPTEWTNKDVELKIDAKDLGSGVSHIQLPNNQIVKGSQATYKISANGTYTFKVYDYFGNETIKAVNVNKIDKTLPELNHSVSIDKAKNIAKVILQVKDSLSGIKNIILPDGKTIDKTDNYSFELNNNGMYCVSVIDNANNVLNKYITINDLSSDVSSGIDRIEYKLSGATTKDWTTYDKPFYISNEGITYITARSYDKAGNVSTEATSEVKIDKTSPTNNKIKIQLK